MELAFHDSWGEHCMMEAATYFGIGNRDLWKLFWFSFSRTKIFVFNTAAKNRHWDSSTLCLQFFE